jgi:hypothetical protein
MLQLQGLQGVLMKDALARRAAPAQLQAGCKAEQQQQQQQQLLFLAS